MLICITELTKGSTKLSTTEHYSIWGGQLHLYRGRGLAKSMDVQVGDVLETIPGPRFNSVVKKVWPEEKTALITALLGFDNKHQARSKDDYERKIERNRGKAEYLETEYQSSSVLFMRAISPSGERQRNIAVFVSKAITTEEILALVPEMVVPEVCVRKVLSEYLGIKP